MQDSINTTPRWAWKAITRDNGTENVLHERSEIPSYFCHPYASWEKGGVENANLLIREYFPKGTNFDTVSEREIRLVEDILNNRPRKSLNYLTPNQAFSGEIMKNGALNS